MLGLSPFPSQVTRVQNTFGSTRGRRGSVGLLDPPETAAPQVPAVSSPHTPGPGLHPVPQPHFCRLHSPICSTISGGKTREAKALRKISENSLSRPPMPIFSKFQSGLMIDCRFSLVFDLPAKPKKRFQTQPSRTPAHTDTRTALQVRPQPMTSVLSFKRWPGGHTVTRTQGQDTRDTA